MLFLLPCCGLLNSVPPPFFLRVAKTVHFTDDNTLESILERQGDGLVARPAEELGCITEGAGGSVLSLRNNK